MPLRKQRKRKLQKILEKQSSSHHSRLTRTQTPIRILTCCSQAVTSGLVCMHRTTRLHEVTREENRCLLTHIQTLVRKQKQVQDSFKMSEDTVPPRCRNPPPCARGGPAPSQQQAGCSAVVVCARRGRLTSYLWRKANVKTETADSNTVQQDSQPKPNEK